jgi:hypothetical protein
MAARADIRVSVPLGGPGRSYGYDRAGYRDDNGWRGGYGDQDGRGQGWHNQGDSQRHAVRNCMRAAQFEASRYTRGRAEVTDIRDVRETRFGYEVRGRVEVNRFGGHDWNNRSWNDRGWGQRDWNGPMRFRDSGSFKCKVEGGRIVDLDLDGIGRL